MIRQGTPEWLAARRELITATDIPVLLGISPYRSEQDLADEKRGLLEPQEPSLRMRIGTALEPMIAAEYSRQTGRRLRRFHGLVHHPTIAWAAASPDYGAVGERLDVELKWSGSRSRFADGLPPDIEAQVAWQLGVMGYPAADVAVLLADELRIFHQAHDAATFAGLVDIAADFRRRLEAGGPFAQSAESIKRRHPADDGTELMADQELEQAVAALIAIRDRKALLARDEEALENAIKDRMGEAAIMRGRGWHIIWKRTKDSEQVDWRAVADTLLRQLPEPERKALVESATTVKPGFRPFRLVVGKGDAE